MSRMQGKIYTHTFSYSEYLAERWGVIWKAILLYVAMDVEDDERLEVNYNCGVFLIFALWNHKWLFSSSSVNGIGDDDY